MSRVIDDRAVSLIKSFEKLRLKSYQGAADALDIYTIGWGHVLTGHEIPDLFKPGQMMQDVSITADQADQLFMNDIGVFIKGLQMRLSTDACSKLTDDQFGALVSFAYNIGLGGFGSSQVMAQVNRGSIDEASNFFKSFVRSGAVDPDTGRKPIVNGLVRRRAAERALYKSDYDMVDYFMNNSNATAINKAQTYIGLVT